KRVLVAGALCPPKLNLLARQIVFLTPHVDLHDAWTNRLLRLKRPSSFEHLTCMIKQPDVCQDCAKAIVSMRQVVLQSQSALEVCNRLQMLKILRRPPKEKSAGDVSFGKIRVNLERSPAMEFSLLQPNASWVEFEVASRAC